MSETNNLINTTNLYQRLVTNIESLEHQVSDLNQAVSQKERTIDSQSIVNQVIKDKYQTILELLPAGVVIINCLGKVVEANVAAEQIFDSKITGEKWSTVVSKYINPQEDDGLEISLVNGKRISVATKSLEISKEQVILLTDLTHTRKLQEKINHQSRLQSIGRMMAFMAHQIRTPLAAMMLYVGHLCNPRLPKAKREEFTYKVKNRLDYLSGLIESLLLFVKNGSPKLNNIKTTDITQDLIYIGDDFKQSSNASITICNCIPDKYIRIERGSFLAALSNIIHNSIQSSGDYCSILISIQQTTDSSISIIISDNGPGIASQHIDRIFEAFYTTKSSGNGLGLAVVKTVVEACRGSVSLESSVNKGTSVEIRLPTCK